MMLMLFLLRFAYVIRFMPSFLYAFRFSLFHCYFFFADAYAPRHYYCLFRRPCCYYFRYYARHTRYAGFRLRHIIDIVAALSRYVISLSFTRYAHFDAAVPSFFLRYSAWPSLLLDCLLPASLWSSSPPSMSTALSYLAGWIFCPTMLLSFLCSIHPSSFSVFHFLPLFTGSLILHY